MSNSFWTLILGASLAAGGGLASDEIRAFRERKRELKAIKISLSDELGDVEAAINKMHEVWEQAKVLSPTYIAELSADTASFDSLRLRLFLMKDKELRKKVTDFYRRLKDLIKRSEGKLGTLAESDDARSEQKDFDAKFGALATDAKSLKAELDK